MAVKIMDNKESSHMLNSKRLSDLDSINIYWI
jgi:hypothetical protein